MVKRRVSFSYEKNKKKRLSMECRAICSEICKIIWKGKCATCGCEGSAAHHFFGWKACSNVRFNFDNLIWLCADCHGRIVHQQGITEPCRHALVARIGEDRYDELYKEAFKRHDYTLEDLETIRMNLGVAIIYFRCREQYESEQQMP